MKRIKQTKIKIKKATNFQKHMHRKEQKKLVHEKIWKFQNLRKLVEEKLSLKMLKRSQLTIEDLIN